MAVKSFMVGGAGAHAKGIMPYMNQRQKHDYADLSTVAGFPAGGSITFTWLEDGSRTQLITEPGGTVRDYFYPEVWNIFAYGKYGLDGSGKAEHTGAHYPWVHIIPQAPDSLPLSTVQADWLQHDFGNIYYAANKAALDAIASTLPRTQFSTLSFPQKPNSNWDRVAAVPGTLPPITFYEFHSYGKTLDDNKWWVYTRLNTGATTSVGYNEYWIPALIKSSIGSATYIYPFLEPGIQPGDTNPNCTIYQAAVSMSDLLKPSHIQEHLQPGEIYSLCFDGNSKHAYGDNGVEYPNGQAYDAVLRITPLASPIYSQYFDRTELNSRVAGEKAWYEDEFLTASQIEAGTNVVLRWRKLDGSLTGYATDPAKGMNLVIEAAGGGGATRHQGALYPFSNANLYYDETTSIIRFQDEPQDYPDSAVALGIARTTLPIYFDLFHDVANDVGIVKARAANNNLHFSVTQLNTVNTYPMDTAGQFNDYTVNHIRLVDTPNLTWNVFGDTMPTLMPDATTAIRQGVIVTPQLNGLYVNWNIRSGNHMYFNSASNIRQVITADPNFPLPGTQMSTFSVDSTDGVDFWGKNGVVCTLIGAGADRLQIIVDRKLLVTDGRQLPADTTYIHFDSGLGTKQGSLQFGKTLTDPDVKIYYAGVSDFGTYFQNVPALPITFEAQNGLRSAGLESGPGIRTVRGMYPRQDGRFASQWLKDYNALDTYRTLSNYAPTNIRPTIEFGFWGWDDANSELNVICSDYNPYSGSDYYTTLFNPIQGGAQGKALRFNWTEGFYYISATVQGIMGMYPGTLPNQQFNPVISQAVHLHLFARPTSNSGGDPLVLDTKILQSFDIMKNYDVVPFIANGVGNNTHALYRQANNSRPWSVQGGGLFWLRGLEEITGLLTLNDGGYNNEFYYQICYIKMNCIKVSNVADIHMPPAIVSQDTNPTSYNYAPQRWHDMNFY